MDEHSALSQRTGDTGRDGDILLLDPRGRRVTWKGRGEQTGVHGSKLDHKSCVVGAVPKTLLFESTIPRETGQQKKTFKKSRTQETLNLLACAKVNNVKN